MHWLIAEDEADIRNLVATMAQVWGHTPMTFESGQKVWDFLDKVDAGEDLTLPEFALMDIRMPGYWGDAVAKRIRETERLKDIPIVLMTAFVMSDEEMTSKMAETGVDHILNKPLPEFMLLKSTLEDVIDKKKSDVSAAAASGEAAVAANDSNSTSEKSDKNEA